MEEREKIARLQEMVDQSHSIVFFGGAGVSTESGIPDFRSTDGLYHQQYAYPPETILSHTFYEQNPEEFFRFYRDKLLRLEAQPNAAHKKLAELEQTGKLRSVVTQNIDGLHRRQGANGSTNCTEASCAIIVRHAASSTTPSTCSIATACPAAAAEAGDQTVSLSSPSS